MCSNSSRLIAPQRLQYTFVEYFEVFCTLSGFCEARIYFRGIEITKTRLLFEMESFQTPRARAGNQSVASPRNHTEVPGRGETGNESVLEMTGLVSE
ncbi:hypothetical protein TNCV_3252721 [Trichonephila clavipes]|nr:hypothetical protein TNCV_3252721 [Trichonephila clavipes]